MTIPEVSQNLADGVPRSLDPRAITLDRVAGSIVGSILSAALLGGAAIPIFMAVLPVWLERGLAAAAVATVLVLLGWIYRWPEVSHRHKSYTVTADQIEIRSGVWWRKVVSVPRSRVQHTDVSQGPLERHYGLGTLMIYTAGTVYSKVGLHGLEHGVALRIRDHLLPTEESDAV